MTRSGASSRRFQILRRPTTEIDTISEVRKIDELLAKRWKVGFFESVYPYVGRFQHLDSGIRRYLRLCDKHERSRRDPTRPAPNETDFFKLLANEDLFAESSEGVLLRGAPGVRIFEKKLKLLKNCVLPCGTPSRRTCNRILFVYISSWETDRG